MQNDWQKYRDFFPTRYFHPGEFDEHIHQFLKQKTVSTILDIGGGAFGTEVLKSANAQVYLLDPYIEKAPDWMVGKVDENHSMQFDLVVCRGAINYLTLEQMQKINSWIKNGGVFMANTFLTPPSTSWVEREVVNQANIKGKERYRLQGNVVEHELIFPDYEIKHEFFYHDLDTYYKAFGSLSYKTHGKNSAIIQVFG